MLSTIDILILSHNYFSMQFNPENELCASKRMFRQKVQYVAVNVGNNSEEYNFEVYFYFIFQVYQN
jgi:hypothetical protein